MFHAYVDRGTKWSVIILNTKSYTQRDLTVSIFVPVIIAFDILYLLWVLPSYSGLTPEQTIVEREANKASSLGPWKQSMPWPSTSGREAKPWIPRSSHSLISTEHRPWTLGRGAHLGFPCCCMKGNLWGRVVLYFYDHDRKILPFCDRFLPSTLCVYRSPRWSRAAGV